MADLKHLHGFDAFDRLLNKLSENVEHKVLQSAASAGARVLAKEIKTRAPEGKGKQSSASKTYGYLKSNIIVQVLRRKKRKGIRGSRVNTGDAFWSWFLEFGTRYMPARPFIRPAVDAKQNEAVEKMRVILSRGIEREIKKLARQK